MSTIIVFGGSAAVGRCLLPRLLARGDMVHAVSRRPPAPFAGRVDWIAGDLFGTIAALPARADTIVSLGPLDAFAAWFAAGSLPAGVQRVLALSSMSAESKRTSPVAAERALAERLRAAEARLAAAAAARGIGWTVFRPTLIYGGGQGGSLAPIAAFARRWHVMPVPIGARGLRQPVHAADIAAAVVVAIDRPAAHGKIYELGGGERLRFDRMLLRLRRALPGVVLPLPVPRIALRLWSARRAAATATGGILRRLREPLVADNGAAAADLDYAPRAFDAAAVFEACDPT